MEHAEIPRQVQDWFNPDAFGKVDEVRKRDGRRAALARVKYENMSSWLVVLKPSLTGSEPVDIVMYGKNHDDFPMQSTLDQFFDDAQWESYRKLGEITAEEVFTAEEVLSKRKP